MSLVGMGLDGAPALAGCVYPLWEATLILCHTPSLAAAARHSHAHTPEHFKLCQLDFLH